MSVLDLASSAQEMQSDLHRAISESESIQFDLGYPVRAYDEPPEQPIYPYLTYGNVRSTDTGGDGAPQSTHQISLHLWSRYSGRSEVLALMHRVETAIHAELSHSVLPIYLDVFRAPDGLTFHGLLRLSITLTDGVTS